MEVSPLLVPIYLAGLAALLFHPTLRRWRPLAYAFVLALAIFMLNRSKPYYTVAAFPPLIAACAVWVESAARRPRLRWLAPSVATYALVSFAITAPFAIPLLPVDTFIAYQDAIGIRPSSGENRDSAELPQFFADRFGWEELAAQVAVVFDALRTRRPCRVPHRGAELRRGGRRSITSADGSDSRAPSRSTTRTTCGATDRSNRRCT